MLFASIAYLQGLNVSDDFAMCLVGGLFAGLIIIGYNIYDPGEAVDFNITDDMSSDEIQKEIAQLKAEEKAASEAERKAIIESLVAKEEKKQSGLRKRKGDTVKSAVSSSDDSKGEVTIKENVEREKDLREKAKGRLMDKKMEKIDEAGDSMRDNEKLRKLFHMSDEDIDKMVAKTKQDVRMGVTPSEPTNYGAWFDTFFFIAIMVALFYFANRDYGFDITFWLAHHFPKEAKVIRAFGGN